MVAGQGRKTMEKGTELDGREPRRCGARVGKVLLGVGVVALAVQLWGRGFDAIWGRHH